MRNRPGPAVLVSRVLTGIITIWCLGCSAFDPIFDLALGGGRSAMSCASEMSSASRDLGAGSVVSAEHSGARGNDCGCGSCHSASPQSIALAAQTPAAPRAEPVVLTVAISVSRAPVAPPPELQTL